MAKIMMSISKHGISIDYRCKSLFSKYKGKKCRDFGTDVCMKCDMCQAEMPAYDATKLLEAYERRSVNEN